MLFQLAENDYPLLDESNLATTQKPSGSTNGSRPKTNPYRGTTTLPFDPANP